MFTRNVFRIPLTPINGNSDDEWWCSGETHALGGCTRRLCSIVYGMCVCRFSVRRRALNYYREVSCVLDNYTQSLFAARAIEVIAVWPRGEDVIPRDLVYVEETWARTRATIPLEQEANTVWAMLNADDAGLASRSSKGHGSVNVWSLWGASDGEEDRGSADAGAGEEADGGGATSTTFRHHW